MISLITLAMVFKEIEEAQNHVETYKVSAACGDGEKRR